MVSLFLLCQLVYIYFQTLSIEVGSVSEKYYIQESVDIEMGGRISSVEGLLHTLLEFCQRNSTTVEESERQVSTREMDANLRTSE